MKKLLSTSFILIWGFLSVSAQRPDSLYITSQSQIDSFQILHPNCTDIEGNVTICGTDITNLNGLNVITTFGSDLMIGKEVPSQLGFDGSNLEGLNNVIHIEGNLLIYGNYSLLNLDGLENLVSIGGNLELGKMIELTAWMSNPKLNSLSGLSNLSSIGGDLALIFNTSLPDLSGLESLTTISGNLEIEGNTHLTNLSGLSNMTTLGGNLIVESNNHLTSFEVWSG